MNSIKCLKVKNILISLLFYSISPVLLSHPKLNAENWMRNLFHKLPETRIRDVLIPGTHKSGSYNILKTSPLAPNSNKLLLLNKRMTSSWAKTQNLSILEQLQKGIRYIELNLVGHQGEIFLANDLISCNLNDVLKDLRSWASTHPYEIVLINANFAFQTLSEAKELHRKFSRYIGLFLAFPLLPPNLLTFGDLWNNEKGRPLILFTPPSFKKFSPRYWDKKKMLQFSKTNAQNINVLSEQILYGSTKGPGLYRQDWSKFYISEFIFKPSTSLEQRRKLRNSFRSWRINATYNNSNYPFDNILPADLVNKSTKSYNKNQSKFDCWRSSREYYRQGKSWRSN